MFCYNKQKVSTTEDAIQSGQAKLKKNNKTAPLVDEIESESETKLRAPRRNTFTDEVWNCYEKYSHEPNRKKHPCLLCEKNGLKVVKLITIIFKNIISDYPKNTPFIVILIIIIIIIKDYLRQFFKRGGIKKAFGLLSRKTPRVI